MTKKVLDEEKMARVLTAHVLEESENDFESARDALEDGEYIGKLVDAGYLLQSDDFDSEENLFNQRVIERAYSDICSKITRR